MLRALIVEDSPEIVYLVESILCALNIHVVAAPNCREAKSLLQQSKFSLYLIDLTLPDGSGLDLVHAIQARGDRAEGQIIVMSGNAEVSAKVSAFSLGADDYITKPFNLLEFRARVEARLRRLEEAEERSQAISAGPFFLEFDKLSVTIRGSNKTIAFSSIEFRILALLARRPGVVFGREQILNQIWGHQISVTDRTVDTHIYTLRKKLGKFGCLIKSIAREGYKFDPSDDHTPVMEI